MAHDLAEAEREVAHSFTVSQHPNICSLLEVFYSCPAKEKLVMVWELVEGVVRRRPAGATHFLTPRCT